MTKDIVAQNEAAKQMDLDAIRFGAYFRRLKTSTEFASAIDDLMTKMIDAQKRRADLLIAEENALVGDGDLVAVRAALAACEEEIATCEKQINGAQRRRQAAQEGEHQGEIDQIAQDARAKADDLSSRLKRANGLIEELRGEFFEADRLSRAITQLNSTLEGAGRQDRVINLMSLRAQAETGQRKTAPERTSKKALLVDRMLLSMVKMNNSFFRRLAGDAGDDAAEIKGSTHHEQKGARD